MVSRNALETTIDVEIAEAIPYSDDTSMYQNPPVRNVPMIGTSIGAVDSDEVGTLGLYIECAGKDGVKEVYALTWRWNEFHAT